MSTSPGAGIVSAKKVPGKAVLAVRTTDGEWVDSIPIPRYYLDSDNNWSDAKRSASERRLWVKVQKLGLCCESLAWELGNLQREYEAFEEDLFQSASASFHTPSPSPKRPTPKKSPPGSNPFGPGFDRFGRPKAAMQLGNLFGGSLAGGISGLKKTSGPKAKKKGLGGKDGGVGGLAGAVAARAKNRPKTKYISPTEQRRLEREAAKREQEENMDFQRRLRSMQQKTAMDKMISKSRAKSRSKSKSK